MFNVTSLNELNGAVDLNGLLFLTGLSERFSSSSLDVFGPFWYDSLNDVLLSCRGNKFISAFRADVGEDDDESDVDDDDDDDEDDDEDTEALSEKLFFL